ncbi:MAG: hypothetical protein D6731_25170 [Planctomycetota bacterium]|nr:MAG: hypothetical protein D6731_25170 [Planctomycetota bacterium]
MCPMRMRRGAPTSLATRAAR